MFVLANLAAGLLLGLGLVVSGMSDPAKVLNFLDLAAISTGGWDASLALVMVGAVGVAFAGFRWVLRRPRPVLADGFLLPASRGIDARLLAGAALFGIGWGLAGLCPGPALTALTTGGAKAWLFLVAMVAGMATARWLGNRTPSTRPVLRGA
jgi:uncharacterized membrane protein YedE/YeeE